jgi:sulfite reductase alpha subunit-like flavoprotein
VLTKLHVAYSRAQAEKRYVQHLLAEQGAEVAAAIGAGGHVYVCGDGAHMAKDVHAALVSLLVAHAGVSEAAAGEQLAAMTKEGRYVRDVWVA